MGRTVLGSKARSAHILDVARKSHGARVQSVTVERFPGGAAVRGEGVGVVSDHNLLTSPRQRLKRPPSPTRKAPPEEDGGLDEESRTTALRNTDLSSLSSALHTLSVTVFTPTWTTSSWTSLHFGTFCSQCRRSSTVRPETLICWCTL